MKGAQRVIVFCLLIAVIPVFLLAIPLYLRHSLYKDVLYSVSESDILEMDNGISTFFCEGHSLQMNSEFNAYQLDGVPVFTNDEVKKLHLEKSMILPDDTLEYWGFFLPNGSHVNLAFCSRYDGSRILVVKGERELRDCGLDQDQNTEILPTPPPGEGFSVTYEKGNKSHNHGNKTRKHTFTTASPIEEENHGGENMDDSLNLIPNHDESHASRRTKLENELHGKPKRHADNGWLDAGMFHGAREDGKDSSISSFESSLLGCYENSILLSQGFNKTTDCTSPEYLTSYPHLSSHHNVTSDGFYYYIFYSDNDYISNELHAVFDISKPTLVHKDAPSCINATECSFSLPFMSSKSVIVEIPTKDGRERKRHEKYILISTCHPRTVVYSIFPITALLLILLCAFI